MSYMKNILALTCVFLWAPLCQADVCSERIVRLANPIFPKSLEEIQVLQKEHFCAVEVAYSINMDGRAENIEYRVDRETCRIFNVAAIRAIRSSQFSAGEYLQVCFMRVSFALQDGEVMWRFN